MKRQPRRLSSFKCSGVLRAPAEISREAWRMTIGGGRSGGGDSARMRRNRLKRAARLVMFRSLQIATSKSLLAPCSTTSAADASTAAREANSLHLSNTNQAMGRPGGVFGLLLIEGRAVARRSVRAHSEGPFM